MRTPFETFVLDRYGPCIVARVKEPDMCAVVTWDGRCIWVLHDDLKPFPTIEVMNVRIPDLTIKGVPEIVELFCDLVGSLGDRNYRPRSSLMPTFEKVEKTGIP
jgi:hypothetical protein